jgi:hypothetical protein
MPIEHERLLSVVGYTGFRQGTQIDPLWNAYLLGLVIWIGDDIEHVRIDTDKNVVFSYRFKPNLDDFLIFDKKIGWLAFKERARELAKDAKFVLTCDIADFYPRIYHHRLENALKRATKNTVAICQIKKILNDISKGVSYGLPVGGPAARLLSELLLNQTDKLLLSKRIKYCRFVDDFCIFGNTKEEIYSYLIYLSETLSNNDGFSLQKNKTRIMSSEEFLKTSDYGDEESTGAATKKEFIKLHIHYDPYSDTAEEDYTALRTELNKFDIISMLSSELQKTRISEGLTRKLIKAVAYIDKSLQRPAVISILDNLTILHPIFPTVMLLLIGIIDKLDKETREDVFQCLREIIDKKSHLVRIPTNLAFVTRVLASDPSEETDSVLVNIFSETSSMAIKKDIILILSQHNFDSWISDQLKRFDTSTSWERRALLISSYILEDEGSAWRKRVKKRLSPFDSLILQWAGESKSNRERIELT